MCSTSTPRFTVSLARAAGKTALQGIPSNPEDPTISAQFPVTDANVLRKYVQTFAYDPADNIHEIHHDAGAASYTRHMRPQADNNQLDTSWDGNNPLPTRQSAEIS